VPVTKWDALNANVVKGRAKVSNESTRPQSMGGCDTIPASGPGWDGVRWGAGGTPVETFLAYMPNLARDAHQGNTLLRTSRRSRCAV
jgi:hypothetical protein